MSMNYWTVTGFGVDEEDLTPAADAQISFIKKYLPDVYEEMQNDGDDSEDDMSNTAEYIDFCTDWLNNYEDDNGNTGFAVLFAMAIQKNEDGFYPEYFRYDGYGAVMYEDRLPWEMTDRVKNMTAADMTAIFKKYLEELGIEAEVQRQSVEFWG